jgi:hypothetical protein
VWNQAVSAGELPVQDIAESVCFAFIRRRKPLILRQLLPLHPQSDGLLACINFRFLSSPRESRHKLAGWLFFANQGTFRTGDYEEIMNKVSALSLLVQRCLGLEHRAVYSH